MKPSRARLSCGYAINDNSTTPRNTVSGVRKLILIFKGFLVFRFALLTPAAAASCERSE